MTATTKKDPRSLFQYLPSVEELLKVLQKSAGAAAGRLVPEARTRLARRVVGRLRTMIEEGTWQPTSRRQALGRARAELLAAASRLLGPHPRPVINATGVVLHTNLGRAPLAARALKALRDAAAGYSDLEFDLESGSRGSRLARVEELLCVLTGAQAALAVNNNAAAVLLALDTMASGRQVIVSRGHLVAIGGSFRMPEIMNKSGAQIVEVGTTNKTYLKDYENAIGRRTALILHVHQSNFIQRGFVHQVPLAELVELGRDHNVPVLDDQGSGVLDDAGSLAVPAEPTIAQSLEAGVAIVSCSGDKLLGGSQAGILLGAHDWINRMKENPLARALRLDKLQLAAMEATLRLYMTGVADDEVPVRFMVRTAEKELKGRAERLCAAINKALREEAQDRMTRSPSGQGGTGRGGTGRGRAAKPALTARVVRTSGAVGGGSSPEVELVDWGVALAPAEADMTASRLERALRRGRPPVVARVSEEQVILNVRTVFPAQGERLPRLVARAARAARVIR